MISENDHNDALTQQIEKLSHLIGVFKREPREGSEVIDQEYLILLSIKALLDSRDVPTWFKSPSGNMLYINPAYEKAYNILAEDYAGKTDKEIWLEDKTAYQFKSNDNLAMSEGKAITADEIVNGKTVRVRKWPVYISDKLIGVAGEVL